MVEANKEVFVVLQDNAAREVLGLPPGKQVVILDYNIEDVDKGELKQVPWMVNCAG